MCFLNFLLRKYCEEGVLGHVGLNCNVCLIIYGVSEQNSRKSCFKNRRQFSGRIDIMRKYCLYGRGMRLGKTKDKRLSVNGQCLILACCVR